MSVYWQHHNDDGNNNKNNDDTTAITLYTKFNSYNSKPLTYLVPGELKQIQ